MEALVTHRDIHTCCAKSQDNPERAEDESQLQSKDVQDRSLLVTGQPGALDV